MSEEELMTVIKALSQKLGATSAKDMGKVMGLATKQLGQEIGGKINP